jgi:hypothetical protein
LSAGERDFMKALKFFEKEVHTMSLKSSVIDGYIDTVLGYGVSEEVHRKAKIKALEKLKNNHLINKLNEENGIKKINDEKIKEKIKEKLEELLEELEMED